jgi:hypothetical protein
LDIEYTQKRLDEVQKLADRGSTIGEGPLDDLAAQTNSLVTAKLDLKDAEKVSELAQQQQAVLTDVAPLVDPKASDELQEAKTTSAKAYMVATSVVAANEGQVSLPSPEPTGEAAGTATAAATATAQPTGQPAGPTATPQPVIPEITPVPGGLVEAPVQNENAAGVSWDLVVVDRLSLQVPSQSSGWQILGLDVGPYGVATAPSLLRVANADLSTIVIINPLNGDTYWDQNIDGVFQESVIRRTDGPILSQATQDELTAFSPVNADIVLHILTSITIAPAPTATPKPLPTNTPEPTVAVSGSATTPVPTPGS